MKILIIDDEVLITELLYYLISCDIPERQIILCNDPSELLKENHDEHYDIILCDFYLRRTSAQDVFEKLKNNCKKFFVMSGDWDAKIEGSAGTIEKPFPKDLVQILLK